MNDRVKLIAYRTFDPTKPALLGKKALSLTSKIAARAYEIYEERGHHDGHANQDWLEAEIETKKDEAVHAKAGAR